MKKLIFGLIAFLLAFGTIQAQDYKKVKKEATKALSAYNLDGDNKEKIQQAVKSIAQLDGMDIPAEEAADVYLLKGDVYSKIADEINQAKVLNLNTAEGMPKVQYPEVLAYKSYKMALEKAAKKYQTKAAVKGLRAVQNYMSFRGVEYYQALDYTGAFNAFEAMLDAHKLLNDNNAESALDGESNLDNQVYLAALAAYNVGKKDASKDYFMSLYNKETEEPAVYEYLYKIDSEGDSGDPEAAYKYLEQGRKKFPDEVGLLFAEINHFLKLGKSEQLIDKIKQAIAAEPENTSLYNVLGNTYDGLYQASAKAGETEKAQEYFGEAYGQFKKAFEIDSKNNIAIYSIGQLFYNKAALKTQDLQKYASDYSKEGMAKYEEARKDVFAQFDRALPFFQMAEALNPNDPNTLIALKEIYAKKDDLDTSNVFKERLDKIRAGEQVGKAHFKPADVDIDVALSKGVIEK